MCRFHDRRGVHANAMMGPADVRTHCRVDGAGEEEVGWDGAWFLRVWEAGDRVACLGPEDPPTSYPSVGGHRPRNPTTAVNCAGLGESRRSLLRTGTHSVPTRYA